MSQSSSGGPPWVRGRLTKRVHRGARGELDAFLDRFSYVRFDIDGTAMTSEKAAYMELYRALGFSILDRWKKLSWDYFGDLWRDRLEDHSGQRIAVVWDHVEVAARAIPITTMEIGSALIECACCGVRKRIGVSS